VIADVLNGGTRVDLTTLLEGGLPSSKPQDASSIANYPTLADNLVPKTIARNMRGPRWAALKEFHDLPGQLKAGALIVRAANFEKTNTNNLNNPNVVNGVSNTSVAPVVTDFRILMGVRFVVAGEGIKTNPCGKIAIAIANPYSVPLKWEQDLEFHIKNQTPPGNKPSRVWNLRNPDGSNEVVYLSDSSNPAEPAVFNNVFFRIRPGTLEPGEVRAYTHAGANFRNRTNPRTTVDLADFASSSFSRFCSAVSFSTCPVATPVALANFRMLPPPSAAASPCSRSAAI
jgi:hypothetical protein